MSPSAEPESAIAALYAAWTDAFRRGDVDAIIAMMSPDYLLWAPGLPPIAGNETMRPMLERTFAAGDITSKFELEERLVDGDLAVDRGWDIQELRLRDGSPPRAARQRAVLILRREEGRWRFARGFRIPGPTE